MKKATKYRATIHTLTIQPILKPEYACYESTWWKAIYDAKLPYINKRYRSRSDNTQRIIINPHRLHPSEDGTKYIFTYQGLPEHLTDMQRICEEMDMDGYIIRRLDVCLDANVPYVQTQKSTRLIALMLGEQFNGSNRYISIDPITLESKTIRIDNEGRNKNGRKVSPTQQIEHYNRALKDQTDYANKPIINRFELRSMGSAVHEDYTEARIVRAWLDRLSKIDEASMQRLTYAINKHLSEAYKAYTKHTAGAKSTKINSFMRLYADHIYTREQMIELLSMLGKSRPRDTSYDLTAKAKNLFRLLTWKEIQAEIDSMKAALMDFIGLK